MSNKINDELIDIAIEKVDAKMADNPTIPEEARHQLEEEELQNLKEREPIIL